MSQPGRSGSPNTAGLLTPAVIAALLVAGVVVACLVVALVGSGSGVGRAAPAASATSSPAPDGTASVCGLPGFDRTSSLVTAPETSWQLVGLMAAPTDRAGSGPGTIAKGGFRSCYAHTAEGALFAVANYTALDTDPRLAPRIPSALLAPGAGRDVQLDAAPAADGTDYRYQVAGFAVRAYAPARALIDLAVTSSDGRLLSLPIEVAWSGGDWKVVTLPNGDLPYSAAAVKTLAGYIPWSGA